MIEARLDDEDAIIQLRKAGGSCCACDPSTRNNDVVCHRLRLDGDLELAVPVLHVLKQVGQFVERNLACDKIGCRDLAAGDCIESFPDESRSVMEARLNRDLGVVEDG